MRQSDFLGRVRSESSPVQVRTRSPMPARPGMVSGFAPPATAWE